MVYRRFGYIQSRLLLEKQNALQLLERQLNMMDSVDDEEDTMRLRTRRDYDEEHMQDRVQLLDQIGTEFTQYCTAQNFSICQREHNRLYSLTRTHFPQDCPYVACLYKLT